MQKKQVEFLTIAECNKLLKFAKDLYPKYYPILLLAIVTGMRQGEILALTWDDIDFKNGVISINKSYSHGRLSTPKTNASIRKVKIPESVIFILKEHYLRVNKNELNLVFPNENGNYINCRNLVNRFFKPCLKAANLREVTWHKLRHSCITALAEKHVVPKAVQNHIGHSSELTTMKIYTHATKNMENELVDVLGQIFAC